MQPVTIKTGRCEMQAATLPMPRHFLRLSVQKSEVDLAKQFLDKGGTLGGAAARGNTSFSISHSEKHDTFLITEANQTIDLQLSDKLIETSTVLYHEEVDVGMRIGDKIGPHVLISDRTRMNVVSTRMGSAINGTLISTMAGTASVPLESLFETVNVEEVATGAFGKVARPNVAFTQIPLRYPNWDAINATLGVCSPQIVRVAADGTETEMSAIFFTPDKMATRMAKVQPLLKSIYDRAWQMTKDTVFKPEPNLHKSVMSERDSGFDMSGYSLAAAANDTPPPILPEVAELLLSSAFSQEMPGDEHIRMLSDLSIPSLAATARWGGSIATALSAIAAYSMPYRVDGTPRVTPTGLEMVQSEAWPFNATVGFLQKADDCENAAATSGQFINQSSELKGSGVDMSAFPNMNAVANSLGAHYIHGMTVLAANAGHADAADSTKTAIAGHCNLTLIPKSLFAMAMERGARSKLNGEFVVEPKFQKAVTSATWDALYPKALLDQIPEAERHHLQTHDAAQKMQTATMATGPQPLAIEGTTYASSSMWKHNNNLRIERMEGAAASAKATEMISPNITRPFKILDVCETGSHAFYSANVETSFSPKHETMTSAPLRSMNAAFCQVRYVQVSPSGSVMETGASPKDIATGNFALVPLWTAGTEDGALIDEAHRESMSNTLPMRGEPIIITSQIFEKNIKTLRSIDAFFHEDGKEDYDGVSHQALVSFASLVGNCNAMDHLAAIIKETPNIRGEIYGLDHVIPGLAVDENGKEAGRYIVIEMELPRN
tara:strand:+ start:1929 stop:4262 length:2334 start_codon:yes stop_codon:yes gene_type:complete